MNFFYVDRAWKDPDDIWDKNSQIFKFQIFFTCKFTAATKIPEFVNLLQF